MSQPIKILQLTSTGAVGGAERLALDLARGCDPARFDVSFASLIGPPLAASEGREGRPPVASRHWGLGWRLPWRIDRLLAECAALRRSKIQIIQTHGLHADLVARLCKPMFGSPNLVSTIHGLDPDRPRVKIQLDRVTARRVDAFVSVSEAGRGLRIAREEFPASKISVIPNGAAIGEVSEAARKAAREAWGVRDDDFPVVAQTANLRPMKGHGESLAAAQIVLKKHPRALFLFAGRDDAAGAFQRQAQAMRLGDRVRFLGFVADAREVVRAADLAILPSRHEGSPMAIIEAMAEERAVVASNVGGIPEQIRDGIDGLLIAPGNSDALAAAILALAGGSELRHRLAASARGRAIELFSREKMIADYERLYESLLA